MRTPYNIVIINGSYGFTNNLSILKQLGSLKGINLERISLEETKISNSTLICKATVTDSINSDDLSSIICKINGINNVVIDE